jgi:hypothetical protein
MKLELFCCIALAGCATTNTPTFSQLLTAAEGADDAIIISATSALNAGSITSAQAKKVLIVTDGINKALTLANTAYQSNPTAGQTQLSTAMALIVTVQACVTAANAKQSIDTCLAPVSTP